MIQGLLDNLNRYGYKPFELVNGSTPSMDYPTRRTPLVTVQMNTQAGCGAGGFFRIPITPGWKLESTYTPTEGHGVSFLPNGDVYDYYHLTPPGVNPFTYSGWPSCAANSNYQVVAASYHRAGGSVYGSSYPQGWQHGYGWDNQSSSASGAIEGAGAVRLLDMQMPSGSTWPHALAISIDITSNGSIWPKTVSPAHGGDGQCGGSWATLPSNAECIPEGARIQLDPSINCNTWASLANAEWKRVMCRTLQTYGAIVRDTGRGISTEWNKASDKGDCAPASCYTGLLGFNWNDYEFPTDLYSHMRIIDWTKWTGAG